MRPLSLLTRLLSVVSARGSAIPQRGCVIYVDPCTADVHDDSLRRTSEACASAGAPMVRVWSAGYATMLCAKHDTTEGEEAEIMALLAPPAGEEAAWAARLGMPVIGVVCGSDAGLECSERLLDALAERSNGRLNARRDKYEMHEALRCAGMPCAKQAVASEWREAAAFLEQLPRPLACVVKPRRGQASLRVGLARSSDEAALLFERVLELPATLDEEADTSSALLQEYLQGEEWVVDSVSRDGEHKILALWRYDKGPANGAPFCYYGIEPVGLGSARAARVAAYALQVLEVLQWRWGPVHMEVMYVEARDQSGLERGPVLVEANAGRLNGEEFALLADVVYGLNAYDAM